MSLSPALMTSPKTIKAVERLTDGHEDVYLFCKFYIIFSRLIVCMRLYASMR